MIEKEIRARIIQAVKAKDDTTRNILRLVIGEVERLPGGKKEDGDWIGVIRKMIKGIDSSIEAAGDTRVDLVAQMKSEKIVLETFLPKTMSRDDIRKFISENNIVVTKELGEGRSMGNVMKALKSSGQAFDNSEVKGVVGELIS